MKMTPSLLNGSIIKAGTLTIKPGSNYFIGGNAGANTDKSMIKANLIKYNWHTYLQGNLVIEATPDYIQAGNSIDCLHVDDKVIQTGFDLNMKLKLAVALSTKVIPVIPIPKIHLNQIQAITPSTLMPSKTNGLLMVTLT